MSKTLRTRRRVGIILDNSNMLRNTSLVAIERRGYIVVHESALYDDVSFIEKKWYKKKPLVIFKVIETHSRDSSSRLASICAICGRNKPTGEKYNGYINFISWGTLMGSIGRWLSITSKEVKFYKKNYDLNIYTWQ